MYALYAENEELAQLWLKQLQQAGVAAEIQFLSLGGTSFQGVAFSAPERLKALEVLGLAETPPATSVDGASHQLLLPTRVLPLLAPGENASAVRAALMPYAEELDAHIVVTNGRGGGVLVHHDPKILRIHIYAFPMLVGARQPQVQYLQIPTIFGVGLPPGACDALTPTGLGKPIVAPEENVTVAEVFEGALYVLLNLTHPCAVSSELIRSVLSPIMELYLQTVRPRAISRIASRRQYAQACARRLRVRRTLLESKLDELGEEIVQLSYRLAEKTRERRQVLEELTMLEQRAEALEASLEDEFDRLSRSPHVQRIEVTHSHLVVTLDHIMVDYAGQQYPLGPYRILLPLDGGRVRVQSEHPRFYESRLYHHPHVWGPEGDQICYGDIAADIAKLLAEKEFGLAIDMLIAFLHEINDNEERARRVLQALWKPVDSTKPCTCKQGV